MDFLKHDFKHSPINFLATDTSVNTSKGMALEPRKNSQLINQQFTSFVLNRFANSPDTGDINTNPCLSTDPDIGDSAFWASKAVEQFANAKFTDAVSTVDACFAQWGPEAGQQQKNYIKNVIAAHQQGRLRPE